MLMTTSTILADPGSFSVFPASLQKLMNKQLAAASDTVICLMYV